MKTTEIKKLETKATQIREDIIKTLLKAKSGHSAGSLGTADIFTALYFNILNINPKNMNHPNRDRLTLSCGHICPVQYVTMAHAGIIKKKELNTLRQLGTKLQGHPHKGQTPGIENTSGPLGQGLSQAIGMALAAKLDKKKHYIYCIMSDGEQQEGQIWEAIMFAGKHKLNNIIAILDRNNIQIDGYTEDIMPLEPLRKKYEAFNWNVIEIDGHNIRQIIEATHQAKATYEKPTIIIAHTIPGKGVKFMEKDFTWHGKPPNKQEAKKAIHQIRTLKGKIKGEHQ